MDCLIRTTGQDRTKPDNCPALQILLPGQDRTHPYKGCPMSGKTVHIKIKLQVPDYRLGIDKLNKPRVINIDLEPAPEGAVYIGRPSKWGNPFKVGKDGTESEVAQKYINWLQSQPELIADAKRELVGKDLACYCKPGLCHGDLLILISNDESFSFADVGDILERLKSE